MVTVYSKNIETEEVILLKMVYGELDFRFIRRDSEGNEIFNNRVELSNFNISAQKQLDEMFDMYKVHSSLRFDISKITAGMPNLRRY